MVSAPFRVDDRGRLVGHGLVFESDEQLAPGIIALDVVQLERLFQLARLEKAAEPDRARARRERTRGAMEDLVEDLGLDPAILDRQDPGVE